MSKILKVRNVNDYSRYLGAKEQHPLVSVIDYAEVSPVRHSLNDYGVYGIFFHDEAEIDLAYGCGKYDYKKGTVICVAPGQIGGKEDNGEKVMLTGWALLFHPDLLHGFPLEKHIREYSFFDYRINEALHMTDAEHDILASLMCRIREELAGKKKILIGTKIDEEGAEERFAELSAKYGGDMTVLPLSIYMDDLVEKVKWELFRLAVPEKPDYGGFTSRPDNDAYYRESDEE